MVGQAINPVRHRHCCHSGEKRLSHGAWDGAGVLFECSRMSEKKTKAAHAAFVVHRNMYFDNTSLVSLNQEIDYIASVGLMALINTKVLFSGSLSYCFSRQALKDYRNGI
ncbi:hypothetical protein ACQUFY_17585 [Robbsia andropogonis]|nr:hypothetical protein [Robbsia andropogonis]